MKETSWKLESWGEGRAKCNSQSEALPLSWILPPFQFIFFSFLFPTHVCLSTQLQRWLCWCLGAQEHGRQWTVWVDGLILFLSFSWSIGETGDPIREHKSRPYWGVEPLGGDLISRFWKASHSPCELSSVSIMTVYQTMSIRRGLQAVTEVGSSPRSFARRTSIHRGSSCAQARSSSKASHQSSEGPILRPLYTQFELSPTLGSNIIVKEKRMRGGRSASPWEYRRKSWSLRSLWWYPGRGSVSLGIWRKPIPCTNSSSKVSRISLSRVGWIANLKLFRISPWLFGSIV
jgi:hypothetical protein